MTEIDEMKAQAVKVPQDALDAWVEYDPPKFKHQHSALRDAFLSGWLARTPEPAPSDVERAQQAMTEHNDLIERAARAYQQANSSGCVSYDAVEAALDAAGVEALQARVVELETVGVAILERKFDTLNSGNGVEADDGEKCWIVHSDEIFALEAALAKRDEP